MAVPRKRGLPLLLLLAGLAFSVPAQAADRLTILLDWFINPDHAPILAAQQTGAYRSENLDVTLIQPSDATMPPKLVAVGHGDLALDSEPQFIEQVAAGLPLVRVGALIPRPLSTLVALGGVQRIADLRGKRIGYGSGAAEQAMVAAVLRHGGVQPQDVHMTEIGEQLTVALLSGRVDAVTVYRNVELLQLLQRGANPARFDYETNGVPGFEELIIVARRGMENDPRIARFLRATAKGTAWLRAHPDQSWQNFARAYPELDDATARASWMATIPLFAADPGPVDRGQYDAFARFLAGAGVVGTEAVDRLHTALP